MRLVILEAESLGKDMDLSGFSRFGEVTDSGLSRNISDRAYRL